MLVGFLTGRFWLGAMCGSAVATLEAAQPSPPAQNYVTAIGVSPLKAPTTADFAPGASFTLEIWVYLSGISTSTSHLMGKAFATTADPYQSYSLQLAPGNYIAMAQSDGAPGSMAYVVCPTAIPVAAWTHVAAVVGSGAIKLYMNGALCATMSSPGAPPNKPTVPFGVGLAYYPDGSANNNPFPGYARQARFWNVARSAAQILAALAETLPTDRAGLVAAWPLDEVNGPKARDISGHGFDLTVASGGIASIRTALADALPFFSTTRTDMADGSLQYVNPAGALINLDHNGKLVALEVQGGPATFPETRTRLRAYRLQNGAYGDATDVILGTVTMVAPARTLVADFNGDGWDDSLIAGIGTDAAPWPGEQAQLLLNDQHGHLVNVTATNLPPYNGAYTHDATCGDIDGDGDLDLYMGNLNGGNIGPRIYLNDGTGKFTDAPGRLPAEIEDRSISYTTYTGCLLVDLNGDGKADLVLGGWPGGNTNNEILLNNGSGSYVRTGAPVLPPKLYGMDGTVVGIKAADLNGDGRTDLLLSTTDHYFHAALQLLLRQADGSFVDATAQMGITWNPSVAEIDRSTVVADINGDGSPDIVAHYYDVADFIFHTRLLLNRGDATFIEATELLPSGPIGTSFQTGDVDGDGVVDFVAAAAPWVNLHRGLKPISLSYYYDAPAITAQPIAQVAAVGATATFTVAATGYPAPAYQWRKNGVNLSGATGASYTVAGAGTGDAGSYTVVVTNAVGAVASAAANLYVVAVAGAPYFTAQPSDQTAYVGGTVTLSVSAGGTPAPAYQWKKNGTAINGATAATLTIANLTAADAGSYVCTATNASGVAATAPAVLTVLPSAYLANLSVRAAMAAGQTLIVGFVVEGGAKPMLVRAAGPVLSQYGLTGVADPSLTLFNGPTAVASNNDWEASLAPTFATLGAFSFTADSKDAALLQAVSGPHTAQSTATGAGAILVEAYDAGPNDLRQLVNLSARFHVGTGDNILIAGFVLSGTGTRQLLIRAVGPTLAGYGVAGALADPRLAVFDGGAMLVSNDDWPAGLAPTFDLVGAFRLNENSRDAATVVTLAADKAYTVQVSGVGGTTGEALVELYLIP